MKKLVSIEPRRHPAVRPARRWSRPAILLVIAASSAASSAARAQPRVELGVAAGGHDFSKTSELGVDDGSTTAGPSAGGLVGVRAALPLPWLERLAVEGEAMVIPTTTDLHDAATVWGLRAHVRVDLMTGRLRPFVLAGVGAQILRTRAPAMSNDVDEELHLGLGVRWAVTDVIDLRVDLRDLLVPDRTYNGATDDYEVTAGVTWRLGAREPAPAPPPPSPPPPPGNRDGDGLTDDVDQCPTQAEDKDGFQDADGCPDPDNDGDGIADSVDQCPDQPETRNGWQDADGCPDQVLAELAGIGFHRDSAELDDQSTPILDRAVAILAGSAEIRVEIGGHTSSEGDPDRNQRLSLARADAVKAYLVAHGVAADRIRAVGYGAQVPIADNATEDGRRANRRIEFRVLTAADHP